MKKILLIKQPLIDIDPLTNQQYFIYDENNQLIMQEIKTEELNTLRGLFICKMLFTRLIGALA
jgi:hypothetical protein